MIFSDLVFSVDLDSENFGNCLVAFLLSKIENVSFLFYFIFKFRSVHIWDFFFFFFFFCFGFGKLAFSVI